MNFCPPGRLLLIFLISVVKFAHGFDLAEAYKLTIANSSEFQVARARYDQALEYVPQARAALFPSIKMSVGENNVSQTLSTGGVPAPQQKFSSSSFVISARQPILMIRQHEAVTHARLRQELAAHELKIKRQELAIKMMASYSEWLLALEEQRALGVRIEYAQRKLAAATRAREERIGTAIDVTDANAKLMKVTSESVKNQFRISEAKAKLELLTGPLYGSPEKMDLDTFRKGVASLGTIGSNMREMIADNPRILSAEVEAQIAYSSMRISRLMHLPSVDLVAQYSSSTGENIYFSGTSARGSSVGVQINLQLSSGGELLSRDRQAAALVREADQKLITVQREALNLAQSAIGAIRTGERLIHASEAAEMSAIEMLRASKRALEEKQATDLDVLEASMLVSNAGLATLQAQYELLSHWVQWVAQKGDLSQETFSLLAGR